jgi:hypothetical protein
MSEWRERFDTIERDAQRRGWGSGRSRREALEDLCWTLQDEAYDLERWILLRAIDDPAVLRDLVHYALGEVDRLQEAVEKLVFRESQAVEDEWKWERS